MKAIILILILFASLLISFPSIAARELVEYKGVTRGANGPIIPTSQQYHHAEGLAILNIVLA